MEALKLTARRPSKAVVLTKALLRVGQILELPQRTLARVIGVSEASLSRLSSTRRVDPESKEGELAALLVRTFRSLVALLGGDLSQSRAWFHAQNEHLSGVPAELVQSAQGLVRVAEYLDAMRGKG